jgi:hypothetical protein
VHAQVVAYEETMEKQRLPRLMNFYVLGLYCSRRFAGDYVRQWLRFLHPSAGKYEGQGKALLYHISRLGRIKVNLYCG